MTFISLQIASCMQRAHVDELVGDSPVMGELKHCVRCLFGDILWNKVSDSPMAAGWVVLGGRPIKKNQICIYFCQIFTFCLFFWQSIHTSTLGILNIKSKHEDVDALLCWNTQVFVSFTSLPSLTRLQLLAFSPSIVIFSDTFFTAVVEPETSAAYCYCFTRIVHS